MTQNGLVIFVVARTRWVAGKGQLSPVWSQLPTLRCMAGDYIEIIADASCDLGSCGRLAGQPASWLRAACSARSAKWATDSGANALSACSTGNMSRTESA